ncbi:extracellular solute-binding protein [Ferroacidibacillus organovorans]|uniref:ABC transporter substrate-binding protein n=1 Tax=Ferroacidibacillus organovorans TaxID=1765683 RepID=A0A1V4ETP1_9BACL|nr:extracellular solute-binding protein [Ferroacidibacillus organovorans]OPG16271.1 ABC transporter substrate-binding protein [Ferroacidibacillus organovorans]
MGKKTKAVLAVGSILATGSLLANFIVLSANATTMKRSPFAGKTITIAYQQFGGGHQTQIWLSSVRSQFQKIYPSSKIVLEPINASENEYYTKLDLMNQSAKTAPDIMVEDTFLVNSDASAGYLMPMNKFVNSWPAWKKDFYPAMQKAAESTNGTVYGVPFNTDTRGLWYDKPLFKKVGLPVPWQPHSWANVLQAARTIKAKAPGVTPLWFYSGKPMGEASTMQGFEMLLYGTHNTLFDSKTKRWVVSSPGFLNSLNFVKTIFTQNLAEPLQNALTPESSTIATQQLMPKQKVGILLDGVWEYSNWLPTGPAPWPQWNSVYGVAKMPNQNGGGFTSMSGGWTLSISSKTKNAQMAWDFIKLACNKSNMLHIDLMDANVTPRKDVAAMPAYKSAGHGILSRFASFNAFTHFRPAFAQYPSISNDIQNAMENVMTGSVSPAQAMQQYAQQVTNYVGRAHVTSVK